MIIPSTAPSVASVAAHYDDLSRFYLQVWGEHVHHGLWQSGRESPEQAVRKLIDRVAEVCALRSGERVCDIGCGYGGTARVLTRDFGAEVTGVTVSAEQFRYATDLSPAGSPRFLLKNWLENDLPSGHFDVAISIESSEHMPDKAKFMSEAHRVLKPGGRIAICAWLAKDLPSPWQHRHLLEPICREGRLPGMGTRSEYEELLSNAGFQSIAFEDVSAKVKKTWLICVKRVVTILATDKGARRLLMDKEFPNRVFALTLLRMIAGYESGALRYGIFSAVKS